MLIGYMVVIRDGLGLKNGPGIFTHQRPTRDGGDRNVRLGTLLMLDSGPRDNVGPPLRPCRCAIEKKKTFFLHKNKIWSSKTLFPKMSLEKGGGGRLIIGDLLYSDQLIAAH